MSFPERMLLEYLRNLHCVAFECPVTWTEWFSCSSWSKVHRCETIYRHSCCLRSCISSYWRGSKATTCSCSNSACLSAGTVSFCDVLAIYISSLTFVSGSLVAFWLATKVNVFLTTSHTAFLGSLLISLAYTQRTSIPVHMSLSGLAFSKYSWREPAACATVPLVTCGEDGAQVEKEEKKKKRKKYEWKRETR